MLVPARGEEGESVSQSGIAFLSLRCVASGLFGGYSSWIGAAIEARRRVVGIVVRYEAYERSLCHELFAMVAGALTDACSFRDS